jgi:hypothetical protein
MRTLTTVPAESPVHGVNYSVTGDGEHAIDLPGFGRSTKPWTRPLLPGYVDTVRGVLDAEGVTGTVSLMGNSMGAVRLDPLVRQGFAS